MRGSPEVADEQPEAHSPVPNLDRVLNVNLSNSNDHSIDYFLDYVVMVAPVA
jgi:hypothetical protein